MGLGSWYFPTPPPAAGWRRLRWGPRSRCVPSLSARARGHQDRVGLPAVRMASCVGGRAGPRPSEKEPRSSEPPWSGDVQGQSLAAVFLARGWPGISLQGDNHGAELPKPCFFPERAPCVCSCPPLLDVLGSVSASVHRAGGGTWGGWSGTQRPTFPSSMWSPRKEAGSPPTPSWPRPDHGCGRAWSGSSLSCPCRAHLQQAFPLLSRQRRQRKARFPERPRELLSKY